MARKKHTHEITNSSEAGLPKDWKRATLICYKPTLEGIKALAKQRGDTLTETVNDALEDYLQKEAAKSGDTWNKTLYRRRPS